MYNFYFFIKIISFIENFLMFFDEEILFLETSRNLIFIGIANIFWELTLHPYILVN